MVDPQAESLDSPTAPSLCTWYLVRLGVHGQIGRLGSSDASNYRTGVRIVCRTVRGIEVGQILRACSAPSVDAEAGTTSSSDGLGLGLADGRILRSMTTEDEMLWQHLQSYASDACESCEHWLEENGVESKLIDVEPLLDGRTIYFHFLSEVDAVVQLQLDQLAAIYEQRVRESKFAQLLNHGCGPGCGTKDAKNGCGNQGGCAVCKVAKACQTNGV